jgi:hypothetical protein
MNKLFTLIITVLLCMSKEVVAQSPQFGNGYVNITKKASGGKVEKDDILEIRMSIHLPWGYNGGASGRIYRVRYVDNIPTNTQMLTGAADSIRILTNEGVTYKRYTLAAGDDAASLNTSPSPGIYNIRINMGRNPAAPLNNSSAAVNGADSINLSNTYPYGSAPKWWTGHLFSTAYRVRVTGNAGDSIILQPAQFIFRRTQNGADTFITAVSYKILISERDSLCQNGLDINLAGESNGTFGRGNTLNRGTGPSVLVPNYIYRNNVSATQNVPDGSYAIVNNLSPRSSTNRNARRVPNCTTAPAVPAGDSCNNRMFDGFWFIDGDHSGSSNATGNLPVAAGTDGGYMLMVNADYITTEAYRQTIGGLCLDTYYEFSAWVRNICPTCGGDSVLNSTYRPGVLPNLTFEINDKDIYSTGEIDTVGWVKKGFMFRTGPSQTSATFSIRNNAQGGGGNDWALDDIRLSACIPTLSMNYNPYVLGCSNQSAIDIRLQCTIRYSYNNGYVYYKWQRSTNNGATWTDIAGTTAGPAVPAMVGGQWQYTTNYNFIASGADSGHRFRVVTATSLASLGSSTCSFTDGNSTYLRFLNCGNILTANLLSFSGGLNGSTAMLNWVVSKETNFSHYEIEKSTDGQHYVKIGKVPGLGLSGEMHYRFTDPDEVNGKIYYRLKMVNADGLFQYSKMVLLTTKGFGFELKNIVNPFSGNRLPLDYIMSRDAVVTISFFDGAGKCLFSKNYPSAKGSNSIIAELPQGLAEGLYTIKLHCRGEDVNISKRLMKINN